MKMFKKSQEAKAEANETNQSLRDTHALPERYAVGTLTAEIEEDMDNQEWEEIPTAPIVGSHRPR